MARRIFFIILAMTVMSFLTAGAGICAGEKVIELNYATFVPPMHKHCQLGESWAKEIEKRTGGKVKISYYPSGMLLQANQIYSGILGGVADIGMSCFSYTSGRFTAMEAIDLPLGYTSGEIATYVINDFYKEFRPKELDDVKILYLHAHGPGILHSKKPVYNLEDLKGLKIRSTGNSAKVTKLLGATPVAMPIGEAYEALRTGVAEAIFMPIEGLKQWKMADVVKYTEECYSISYTTGFFVAMNKNKWNSLPPDIQKVFEEVSAAWIPQHAKAWDANDEEGRQYALGLGGKIITLSPEESARWERAVKPVVADYIDMAEKKDLPGKKYIKTIKKLIKKYEKK